MAEKSSGLHVFLVKPSKYDDEGFVVRHWRGVLPSNTLACLNALTREAGRSERLRDVDLSVHVFDEAVEKVPVSRIARLHRRGEKVVVGLVGVQTNQFCRATDLAFALRREGVPVIVGGFHVSGVMALFPDGLTPDLQRLVDAGASLVAGEVEEHWAEILEDAYRGRLAPVYRFLAELPDLSHAPSPVVHPRYLKRFVSSNFGTIDCSRGCPFNCSFCTIINVQGRKSRHRSPECIAGALRENYREHGVNFYFFTDDDFARNPAWESIFDALIELRETEGVPVDFMIQVDVQSHRIPGFVEKAARAGCSNVFIGMESLNPDNLKAAGKTQNKVKEYRNLIDTWHRHKVSTHVGYIIGFPHDTEDSVRADVKALTSDVRPHRASFFMLTPLPGSRDHKQMVDAGMPMSDDYNTFDSFHESMPHPHLKNGSWTRLYREAWSTFYSFENMKTVLSGVDPRNYWDVFRNFLWYKCAAVHEGAHPMITGFFRLKDRRSRRDGFPREGRLRHVRRRVPEIYQYLRSVVGLLLEMEELWLQTRRRGETERRVMEELGRMRGELRRSLRLSELQTAYARARASLPGVSIPSRLVLLRDKLSVRRVASVRETRRDLALFWAETRDRVRRGRVDALLRFDRVVLNALREVRLATGFLIALATGERQLDGS